MTTAYHSRMDNVIFKYINDDIGCLSRYTHCCYTYQEISLFGASNSRGDTDITVRAIITAGILDGGRINGGYSLSTWKEHI